MTQLSVVLFKVLKIEFVINEKPGLKLPYHNNEEKNAIFNTNVYQGSSYIPFLSGIST